MPDAIGVVHWGEGDPARTRRVRTICRRCNTILWSRGLPTMSTVLDLRVVSPGGCGHAAGANGEPVTLCGVRADTAEWWWLA